MGCISTKPTCVICYDIADQILFPCGHYCLCANCATQLSNHQSNVRHRYINIQEYLQIKCPLCRSLSVAGKVHI